MRRLLSTQDERSLVTMYLKQTKSEFIPLDSDDELLELFLPNSLSHWKAVKKYINKNIMHSERNNAAPPQDWSALKLIISDMKSAFDRMTLPSASYSLDEEHTTREATKLFNKIFKEK